jgi:hypothetical protein
MFRIAGEDRWRRDLKSLLVIICALTLVYAALVYAPYRLLDDNWLLRGYDPTGSYPGLGFIAFVQGRPIFAALIWLSRALAHQIGSEPAMMVLRALGIGGLAVFAWLLHRFIERLGVGRAASLAIAIAAATLPTFQIYVGDGPWLTLPLVLSAAAVGFLSEGQTAWRASAAVVLFGLSLATYQATPFIAIPLAMFAFISRPLTDSDSLRAAAWVVGCLFMALAIYYVLWRLAYLVEIGTSTDIRYNPTALINDPLIRASQFWSLRVPQAFKLWDVSVAQNNVPLVSAVVILIGLGVHALTLLTKQSLAGAIIETALRVAFFCAAFVVSDTAALASPILLQSYTTVVGPSLCVYLALCWSLVVIARTIKLVPAAPLMVVCVSGMIAAQMTVVRRLVLPLNLEAANFRSAVRAYIAEHGRQPDRVQVSARPMRQDQDVYQEYVWKNLHHEFYVHWFILNQFADMGLDGDVEVVVLNGAGSDRTLYPARRPLPQGDVFVYDAGRGAGPGPHR